MSASPTKPATDAPPDPAPQGADPATRPPPEDAPSIVDDDPEAQNDIA